MKKRVFSKIKRITPLLVAFAMMLSVFISSTASKASETYNLYDDLRKFSKWYIYRIATDSYDYGQTMTFKLFLHKFKEPYGGMGSLRALSSAYWADEDICESTTIIAGEINGTAYRSGNSVKFVYKKGRGKLIFKFSKTSSGQQVMRVTQKGRISSIPAKYKYAGKYKSTRNY